MTTTATRRKLPLRIYLDTAMIGEIADKKADPAHVQQFHGMLNTGIAAVVISVGHLWDISNNPNESTRSAMYDAIDEFPLWVFCPENPVDEEKPVLDAMMTGSQPPRDSYDLLLGRMNSVRDALQDTGDENMQELARMSRAMAEGHEHSRQATRMTADIEPTDASTQLLTKIVNDLMSGKSPRQVLDAIVASPVPESGEVREFMDEFRASLEKNSEMMLRGLEGLRREIATFSGSVDEYVRMAEQHPLSDVFDTAWSAVPRSQAKWKKLAKRHAPGTYFEFILRHERTKNLQRKHSASDLPDQFHAGLLPYVDIATVDAENHSSLQRAVQDATKPRLSSLLRNGSLHDVCLALHKLAEEELVKARKS